MDENNKKYSLKSFMEPLEKEIADGSPNIKEFKSAFKELKNTRFRLQQLLEYQKDESKDFLSFYNEVAGVNYVDLIDELNKLGFAQRNNSKMKDAFKTMGYRLMEQTRAGKREDVFHSLLRIHISSRENMNPKLVQPFKHPDDGMFKVLIFSYLSGAIDTKTKSEK